MGYSMHYDIIIIALSFCDLYFHPQIISCIISVFNWFPLINILFMLYYHSTRLNSLWWGKTRKRSICLEKRTLLKRSKIRKKLRNLWQLAIKTIKSNDYFLYYLFSKKKKMWIQRNSLPNEMSQNSPFLITKEFSSISKVIFQIMNKNVQVS